MPETSDSSHRLGCAANPASAHFAATARIEYRPPEAITCRADAFNAQGGAGIFKRSLDDGFRDVGPMRSQEGSRVELTDH